jgi:hypothetical protein
MAFTRFHDDLCRINKQVEESTAVGRYIFATPGPGTHVPFETNPHYRLQKYAANITTNSLSVETDLIGLTRPLSKDCYNYNEHSVPYSSVSYDKGTQHTAVEESRSVLPPYLILDKDITEYGFHPLVRDVQKGARSNIFYNNNSSRVQAKEVYEALKK